MTGRLALALMMALAAGCGEGHHYTCSEVLGAVPGQIAVLPPKWSVEMGFDNKGRQHTGRVFNSRGEIVCDAKGRDVISAAQTVKEPL
jgi:hypothetical protein